MAMLTGDQIRTEIETERIKVDPFVEANIQPSSLDLRLGNRVKVYSNCVGFVPPSSDPPSLVSSVQSSMLMPMPAAPGPDLSGRYLSLHMEEPPPNTGHLTREFTIDESGWVLRPGILYLMHTLETLSTDHFATDITGKSSTARIGIQVHLTAGFGDPGFSGQYTLEVSAVHPAILYPGDLICQARFWTLCGRVTSYQDRGRYVGDRAQGPHSAAPRKADK